MVFKNMKLQVAQTFLRKYHGRLKPSKSLVPEIISTHIDSRVTEIIDVRTPDEYDKDHIPGSINLPVLNNEERHEVGYLHSKCPFEARKIGASLISKNISGHLKGHFYSKTEDYSPLVYCWRGGQRSYSLGLVLAQIGFQTFCLENGYKQYRTHVRETLDTLPQRFQFKVISGLTGSGKTHLLHMFQEKGEQIIDLEGLARHKGSVLGLWHGHTQPSQVYFESLLCQALESLTPDRPVWLESESVRIGYVHVPANFFQKLKEAPRFYVSLPLDERVKHIIRDYPNWIENKDQLKDILGKLVAVRGHETVNRWIEMVARDDWETFVRQMLVEHYDPTYTLSQKKNNVSQVDVPVVEMENLDVATLERVVDSLTGLGRHTETDEARTVTCA